MLQVDQSIIWERKLVELNDMERRNEVRRRCAKKRVNFFFCLSGIFIGVNLLYLTPSSQTTYCRIRYPFATVPRHTLMSGTMLDYLIPSIVEQIFSREVFQWASRWRSALVGGCCVSAWCGWVRTIGIDWRHIIYCFTWILSEVGDLCKKSQKQRVEWKCLCQSWVR